MGQERLRRVARFGARWRVGLVAPMLLCLPSPARAQTPPGPAAPPEGREDEATGQARALFNDATSKARHGDWSQALPEFERSSELRPHAITTYNVGFCERALGRATRARKMFGKALAENAAHGGAELPVRLANAARGYLAEIEGRIARAVITVAPEGVFIQVDGRPLELGVTGGPRPVLWAGTRNPGSGETVDTSTFEVEVDPGEHVIVASKTGFAEAVTTRDFEPGSEADLLVKLSPLPAPGLATPPLAAESPRGKAAGPSRVPLYVALGVGGEGLMTGLVAGGIALAQKANVLRNCSPTFACTGAGETYLARTDTAADVSTAGFIIGGAGALTAIVIWWLSPRSGGSSGKLSAPTTPWVMLGGGGLVGAF